jgi:2-C-methyl-D-erythritol 4-phosphate cytidylyltransferase
MTESYHKSQISNLKSQIYVIIVAGGSGTRMQAGIPKQFLLLNGKPVLMRTLEAFDRSAAKPQIILVLAAKQRPYWEQLCRDHNFHIPHQVVIGGETRFHSAQNGLDVIENSEDGLVAIHDAVRPLTSVQIIDNAYKAASEYGNAIAAVKSGDSIRQLKNDGSVSLDRDKIYLVQTPQTFRLPLIKQAYRQPYNSNFTDDASVAEQAGIAIHIVEGSYQNIKITFPEDILIAEALLNAETKVNGS